MAKRKQRRVAEVGFQVIPAIDLKGGQCVRLRQGREDDVTVYAEDPVAMAHRWAERGAGFLHVVDLDGAFQGQPVHGDLIRRMVAAVSVPIEVGGGLRTDAQIDEMLAHGVRRVVIGTRALEDVDALQRLAKRYGERLVVGIDARDGHVQVRGWKEQTTWAALDLARRAVDAGIRRIIYTDTARDGMLEGVNGEAVQMLCRAVSCRVVASGGVSSVADIRTLAGLACSNLEGVIVGKALYEGSVAFEELVAAVGGGRDGAC